MATKVLLVSAMLWSFFTYSEAELSVKGCVGGSIQLQVPRTSITCKGITLGLDVIVSWIVTSEVGGLIYHAECKYFVSNTDVPTVCSPISAMYNTSLNRHRNISELTVDLSNSSNSQINVSCSTNTTQTNCVVQYSPENTTTITTSVQTTSTTTTTTTTAAVSEPSAPPPPPTTTPSPTSPSPTSPPPSSPPPPSPRSPTTTSPTSTTTTASTTGLIMGKVSITAETTHITSAASTATVDNTLSWTTDRVTPTEGTRILDQAEVAAIAGGVAAFVALLVVLVIIVLVCRRRGKQKKYNASHGNKGTRASSARKTASEERKNDTKTADALNMTSHTDDSHHRNLECANPTSDVYPYGLVVKSKQLKKTSTAAHDFIIDDVGSCGTAEPIPDNLTMSNQHPGNHERRVLLTKAWSPVIPSIIMSQQKFKQPPDQSHSEADIDKKGYSGELAIKWNGTLEPETEMYATARQVRGDRLNVAKPKTAFADHTTDHVREEPYNTLSFTPLRPSMEAVEKDYSHVTSHVTDDLEYSTLRYDASRENPLHTGEDDYNHITR